MNNNSITRQAYEQNSAQGVEVYHAFLEETKKTMELTTALLMKLLNDNKDTEYGKIYDFANIHTIEDYQKKVPVVVYDHLVNQRKRQRTTS